MGTHSKPPRGRLTVYFISILVAARRPAQLAAEALLLPKLDEVQGVPNHLFVRRLGVQPERPADEGLGAVGADSAEEMGHIVFASRNSVILRPVGLG